jgi:hypothetical protein
VRRAIAEAPNTLLTHAGLEEGAAAALSTVLSTVEGDRFELRKAALAWAQEHGWRPSGGWLESFKDDDIDLAEGIIFAVGARDHAERELLRLAQTFDAGVPCGAQYVGAGDHLCDADPGRFVPAESPAALIRRCGVPPFCAHCRCGVSPVVDL